MFLVLTLSLFYFVLPGTSCHRLIIVDFGVYGLLPECVRRQSSYGLGTNPSPTLSDRRFAR